MNIYYYLIIIICSYILYLTINNIVKLKRNFKGLKIRYENLFDGYQELCKEKRIIVKKNELSHFELGKSVNELCMIISKIRTDYTDIDEIYTIEFLLSCYVEDKENMSLTVKELCEKNSFINNQYDLNVCSQLKNRDKINFLGLTEIFINKIKQRQ